MGIDNVTTEQSISDTPALGRKPYQTPNIWRLGDIQEVVQASGSAGADHCCSAS